MLSVPASLLIGLVVGPGEPGTTESPLPSVSVVRRRTADALVREASTRLVSELLAAEFRAGLADCAPGIDPDCPMATTPVGEARVGIEISRAPGGAAIDIAIAEHGGGPWLTRTLEVTRDQGAEDPSLLAIRAVEALRAALLELASHRQAAAAWPTGPPGAPGAAPAEAPTTVADAAAGARADAAAGTRAGAAAVMPVTPELAAPEPASPPHRSDGAVRAEMVASEAAPPFGRAWGLAAGGTWLQGTHGLGAAGGLLFSASYQSATPLGVSLLVGGPVFASTLHAPEGSASLRQELAAVELTWQFRRARALQPFVAAGGGAFHLRVQGQGLPPHYGVTGSAWSLLSSAGFGARIPLRPRFAILVQARMVLTLPALYVRIGETEAGQTGRPSTLAGVAAQWEL